MTLSQKSQKIKGLRDLTAAPLCDCARALELSKGDIDAATYILRELGFTRMRGRTKSQNHAFVTCYTHHNKQIGVMVEIHTETDFCAQTEEVKNFAHQLAMHIAASRPLYIGWQDVTTPMRQQWEDEAIRHVKSKHHSMTKVEKEKIYRSRMHKYIQQNCLLHQLFICDEKIQRRIEEVIADLCNKTGERITVSRFTYFEAGGESVSASSEKLSNRKTDNNVGSC